MISMKPKLYDEDDYTTVTARDISKCKSILGDFGLDDRLHRTGFVKLIRACRGKAWDGNPEHWEEILRGTIQFYIKACDVDRQTPTAYTLYINRKAWTRAYASSIAIGRFQNVVLYEAPPTTPEDVDELSLAQGGRRS